MPELNSAELAARYGWSMAVLNSSPDLAALFQQAVAGTWTPEKFTAELRNTNWFKSNAESVRSSILLQATDPATWQQRVANQSDVVSHLGTSMGAVLTPGIINQIASDSIRFGWNEQTIRSNLANHIKYSNGELWGTAQQQSIELREYAHKMGMRIDDQTIKNWVSNVAATGGTIDAFKGTIMQWAKSAFPQFINRFAQGETLEDIAAPYRQSMSQLLEMPPTQIDVFDPTIRGALSAKDAKTGEPAMKSIWEFENDLRKDKRWLRTTNAQNAASTTVNRVLTDMGLIT